MDCAAASKELILALRGQRSQVGLSRRLGYTSNVLYTWEHGRRAPVASAFFRLAARVGVDVNDGLRHFLADRGSVLPDVRRPAGVSELVRALMTDWPIVELAESVGADRTTVGRWVNGATEPKLPELLRIVETTTQRLLDFLALFVDPESMPSARAPYRDLQVQRRLAYDMPWSHGVLRALELEQYRALPRHQPGLIAAELGISLDEEQRCLQELARAGQIRMRRGRWVLGRVLTVDTRPSEADNRRLKLHFADTAAARLRDGSAAQSALFSFNLFAINAADFEKIRRLHVEYYQRIRELIAASSKPDRVVLMNLQLCPLAVGPAAEAASNVAK
jgi:transcriptional regulator with XRE-family HTH domain